MIYSKTFTTAILLIVLMFTPAPTFASAVHIYVDADMTDARAAGIAIVQGIRTALDEVGDQMDGRPVGIVIRNHRGNSSRSKANLLAFLNDPNALALFAGQHSHPLLINRDFINRNGILTLDPWAAAGPITRPDDTNNWIFRLSIDNSKAGSVITRRGIDDRGFSRPALLLENTGWGENSLKTMTASLKARGIAPTTVNRFDWGVSLAGAKILLRTVKDSGADVIFLVSNAPEGETFSRAMFELEPEYRLPIISHWGITGGDFHETIPADIRAHLDLEFLQTSFSFMDMGDAPLPNAVFKRAARLFHNIDAPGDIEAPTGFVHAYDLTRLLLAAVRQAGLTGDMQRDRAAIRDALENLKTPVPGLIKTYDRPFSPYSPKNPDAHEALGEEHFTFGRYTDDNAIQLVR